MLSDEEKIAQGLVGDALHARALSPWEEEGADPNAAWVLSEWVAVCAWTNMADGENRIVRLSDENMLLHHRTGLLHEALKDDWSDK